MTENKPLTHIYDPDTQGDAAFDPDDDIPDMSTPYWVAKFEEARAQRGRPKAVAPKVSTTLRLDADVLERFRAGGKGWQGRMNEALRRAVGL
jgi:uncharacterized protein (DUF4415 family)